MGAMALRRKRARPDPEGTKMKPRTGSRDDLGQGNDDLVITIEPVPQPERAVPVRPSTPIGAFKHTPANLYKHIFIESGNSEVDRIAGEVTKIFDERVLTPRRNIDVCLTKFKESTDNPDYATIHTCLKSWTVLVSPLRDKVVFRITYSGGLIDTLLINNDDNHITHFEQAMAVQDKLNTLLKECHMFLHSMHEVRTIIKDLNDQIARVFPRTSKTEDVREMVKDLEPDIQKFVNDVKILLNDINSAVSNHLYIVGKYRRSTGLEVSIKAE